MRLSPTPEAVLKYIIETSVDGILTYPKDIYSDIGLSKPTIDNALKSLHERCMINIKRDYEGLIMQITLLNEGEFYFETLSSQASLPASVTINNSQGFAIGNNNTVSVTSNTDFADIYALIDNLNNSNKETIREFVSTIQDCLENSKPLPKGKFKKAIEITSDILPIVSSVGGIIMKFMSL